MKRRILIASQTHDGVHIAVNAKGVEKFSTMKFASLLRYAGNRKYKLVFC